MRDRVVNRRNATPRQAAGAWPAEWRARRLAVTAAELTIAAGEVVMVMPGNVHAGSAGLPRSLEEV